MRTLFLSLLALLPASISLPAKANDLQIVERWLATNGGVRSVKIDFTQTRTMRSIKLPVTQTGSLWLDYNSGRFRWQVGNPAQTIVVKPDRHLFIIRPSGKKYEKRAPGQGQTPAMAVLAKGFPRSIGRFQAEYRLLKVEPKDNTFRIVAAPKGSGSRGVNSFTYVVRKDSYRLVGVEISLKDGSYVNTVFNRVQSNASVPLSLFQPSLEGYKETKF